MFQLDVGIQKTVPEYLKKLSDVVASEVVENTKFNILKTKVNNLEKKKNPDAKTFLRVASTFNFKFQGFQGHLRQILVNFQGH